MQISTFYIELSKLVHTDVYTKPDETADQAGYEMTICCILLHSELKYYT